MAKKQDESLRVMQTDKGVLFYDERGYALGLLELRKETAATFIDKLKRRKVRVLS